MSLETQLIALANQIGVDIATLQTALATAQTNLQDLQAQVDAGTGGTTGVTMEDVTTLLQASLGNPERDFVQAYRDAVLNTMLNPPGVN